MFVVASRSPVRFFTSWVIISTTFHRLDEARTKVLLQLDYDPQGLAENVGDKLGFVKRQATGDLKRFKEFIETRGGVETGAWRGRV